MRARGGAGSAPRLTKRRDMCTAFFASILQALLYLSPANSPLTPSRSVRSVPLERQDERLLEEVRNSVRRLRPNLEPLLDGRRVEVRLLLQRIVPPQLLKRRRTKWAECRCCVPLRPGGSESSRKALELISTNEARREIDNRVVTHLERPPISALPRVDDDEAEERELLAAEAVEANLHRQSAHQPAPTTSDNNRRASTRGPRTDTTASVCTGPGAARTGRDATCNYKSYIHETRLAASGGKGKSSSTKAAAHL